MPTWLQVLTATYGPLVLAALWRVGTFMGRVEAQLEDHSARLQALEARPTLRVRGASE